jgi:hypothetical protein
MKPNKILLRIAHFFGLRKDTVHMDDIMFRIPTSFKDNETIKELTYRYLKENPAFDKKCKIVHNVYLHFTDATMICLWYFDDILYHPRFDEVALNRIIKLKELGV